MILKYKAETVLMALDKRLEELEQRKKEEIETIISKLRSLYDNIKPTYYERFIAWWKKESLEKDYNWISELKNNLINGKFLTSNKRFEIDAWREITYDEWHTNIKCSDLSYILQWIRERKEQRDLISKVDFKEVELTSEEAGKLNL